MQRSLTTPMVTDHALRSIQPLDERVHAPVQVFDHLYVRHARRWLSLVLIIYAIAAGLFAWFTPEWQAPDEPAHYNYIDHVASGRGLPVLQMGDYDQTYISRLISSGFTRRLPTAPLRYESYQPPLYYMLITPVFWASGGELLALRLFGIVVGISIIYLNFLCLELVFPEKTLLSLGAAAFTALLPMHVSMTAAVNNDGLAEMLLMASMLVLLQWMRGEFYGATCEMDATESMHTRDSNPSNQSITTWRVHLIAHRQLVLLGLLIGLGMLTKIYAYMLLPVAVLTVVSVTWARPRIDVEQRDDTTWSGFSRRLFPSALSKGLWVLVPSVVLAFPLWMRNVLVYGAWDFLGLRWHDQVVIGQARTTEWIASNGWIAYGERIFGFTFRSFWGVFGWMGVFMDERVYQALLLFSGVIFMGVLWATVRFISGGPDMDMDLFQICVLGLFGIMLIAVTASYLWYNVKFVQHQGRYFFWGLLPISTIVALGWREVLQPLQGAITGFLAAVLAGATIMTGYMATNLDKWYVLSISVIAVLLLLQPIFLGGVGKSPLRWLPKRVKHWMAKRRVAQVLGWVRMGAWALPFLLLGILDLVAPQVYIVPQLSSVGHVLESGGRLVNLLR